MCAWPVTLRGVLRGHWGHGAVPQARRVWGCAQQFPGTGKGGTGRCHLLQSMLGAVPELPKESGLGKALAGILAQCSVGWQCCVLSPAQGTVPSPGLLSLELPQQQLKVLGEEL